MVHALQQHVGVGSVRVTHCAHVTAVGACGLYRWGLCQCCTIIYLQLRCSLGEVVQCTDMCSLGASTHSVGLHTGLQVVDRLC